MVEVSKVDAIEGCHSTEDDRLYFNLRHQLIRRGPGGEESRNVSKLFFVSVTLN